MNIISITVEAWDKIHEKLEAQNSISVLIGVKPSGCNGFRYTFELLPDKPMDDDIYLKDKNHYVIIDKSAKNYLQGSELYWDGLDSFSKRFMFRNPNITSECGCKESFSINSNISSS